MKRRVFLRAAPAALLGVAVASDVRAEMTASEVEEALTCQCGCGLTVRACNHLQCSFAVPVRKDIVESLARGERGEHIIERYRLKYGEKVLSSPVPEGFNLFAWIAPYAGILIVGTLMVLLFRRGIRKRELIAAQAPTDAPEPEAASTSGLEQRRAQLRREVEEMER